MEEIWKEINHPGEYKVSNLGRIMNRKGRILKTHPGKGGYVRVKFSHNGKRKSFILHRLVAIAFVPNPNPNNKPDIHHKNHVKTDNKAENLMWVTPQENNALNIDNPNRPQIQFTPTPELRMGRHRVCVQHHSLDGAP